MRAARAPKEMVFLGYKKVCLTGLLLLLLLPAVTAAGVGFLEILPAETTLLYRSYPGNGEESSLFVEALERAEYKGVDAYIVNVEWEGGARSVGVISFPGGRPILIQDYGKNGKKAKEVKYINGTVHFTFPEKKKTVNLSGEDYYDLNTLALVFRTFPFGQGEKVDFRVVMDGARGSPLGTFNMYVQEAGREQVAVPAGEYDCYKLEMGVGGFAGVFARNYKYYFWYTAQEPHFLVRYEEKKEHGVTELVATGGWETLPRP